MLVMIIILNKNLFPWRKNHSRSVTFFAVQFFDAQQIVKVDSYLVYKARDEKVQNIS